MRSYRFMCAFAWSLDCACVKLIMMLAAGMNQMSMKPRCWTMQTDGMALICLSPSWAIGSTTGPRSSSTCGRLPLSPHIRNSPSHSNLKMPAAISMWSLPGALTRCQSHPRYVRFLSTSNFAHQGPDGCSMIRCWSEKNQSHTGSCQAFTRQF